MSFKASYGRNYLVVKVHGIIRQQYPAHVKAATVYGRLTSRAAIVNVDFLLDYNGTVSFPVTCRRAVQILRD